jgi:hypothetical protein
MIAFEVLGFDRLLAIKRDFTTKQETATSAR